MPSQNPQPANTPSPFEIVTPSKSNSGGKKGLLVAILVVVFLLLSVVAGVLLVRNNQNVQEKAASTGNSCPGAQACPVSGQTNLLRNCTPPEADNSPTESLCNRVGRVESCGGKEYCCPTVGGTWTTNMTACTVVATPTPTPTTTPTATSTATPAGSATPATSATPVPTLRSGTATPAAQKTSMPIPVTGTGWPTYVGAGVGVIVIIASILLAL